MSAPAVDRSKSRLQRTFDALCIGLFVAALCAPTLDLWARPDSARSPQQAEKRLPEPRPALPRNATDWLRFPQRYQAHYKDSFGLRDKLLRWNSLVEVFGLGVSSHPNFYLGKQYWLFYGGDLSLRNRRGKHPFQARDLESWAQALETRRVQLAARGARYLYVVAPDKESVYPEFLPDALRAIGPTRLDQWLGALRRLAPEVEILDLRGPLLAQKHKDREGDWIYNPAGTHWSGRGALLAVGAILERLRSMGLPVSTLGLDDYERVEIEGNGDSAADAMYIPDVLVERVCRYAPPKPRARIKMVGASTRAPMLISQIDDPSLPRMLLLHDSFGDYIDNNLGEHAAYLRSVWGAQLILQDLESIRPDVVIDLFVERALNHQNPLDFVPRDEQPWGARFEASNSRLVSLDRQRPDWGLRVQGQLLVGPAQPGDPARLPIEVRDVNDKLVLPPLQPIAGQTAVLHVTLDSPADDRLTLFYRPRGSERFLRRNQFEAALRSGRNELFLALDRPDVAGDLLLSLGEHPGHFTLFDLEIRSVRVP